MYGNNTNTGSIGNGTLEPQINGLSNNFGRVTISENSACQEQVIEKNIDDKIRKAVDDAVILSKIKCMTQI